MVLIHCRFLICNLLRRLQNAQRLFERVVLIQEDIGVNITLNLRAIQIFQIGKFSRDQLGIEEARVFPQDVSAKVLRSDDPVAFTSGRSRTGTMWAESGSKMCSIAGALDAYANRSRQARSSSFPSQPWVAGSPLVPAFRQEDAVDAPELPDATKLNIARLSSTKLICTKWYKVVHADFVLQSSLVSTLIFVCQCCISRAQSLVVSMVYPDSISL